MKVLEWRTSLLLIGVICVSACSDFKNANPVFNDLIKSAKNGNAEAQFELAVLLERGWLGDLSNRRRVVKKWYKKAAKQGYAEAQYSLRYFGHQGDSWLKKAAEQGHPSAQYEFGMSHCSYDSDNERMWVRRSAAQGYANAYSQMSHWAVYEILEANPEANPEDPDYALEHEEECREYKEWERKYNLAQKKKPYTESDKVLIKWLTKLAMQGKEEAQAELGDIYYFHDEIDKAERWYRQAAELDSVRGQYGLGLVCKDKVESAKWYTKAAENGDIGSQRALGNLYSENPLQDDELSFKWYLAAAEQGSYWAQANVAKMYIDGVGVESDEREALKWFLAPNNQGRGVKGVSTIIYMYINEKGVLEDPIEACAWQIVMDYYPREIPQDVTSDLTELNCYNYQTELVRAHAEKLTPDQLKIVRARAVQICLETSDEEYIKIYKNK